MGKIIIKLDGRVGIEGGRKKKEIRREVNERKGGDDKWGRPGDSSGGSLQNTVWKWKVSGSIPSRISSR